MSYGDLSNRVNQLLAGRASAKDRRDAFLVDELHIDPESLPLTLREVQSRLKAEIQDAGLASIRFIGTSMGLVRVETTEAVDDEPDQCPHCGSYELDQKTSRTWVCLDCDHIFKWAPEAGETIVRAAPKSPTWIKYLKWYETLVREVRTPVGPDGKPIEPDQPDETLSAKPKPNKSSAQFVIQEHVREHDKSTAVIPVEPAPTPVRFEATANWQGATITPLPSKPPRWKRANKYPTGTILRVRDQSGALAYVRVGGLINDDDIVILGSMQAIDPAIWTVIEVLEQ